MEDIPHCLKTFCDSCDAEQICQFYKRKGVNLNKWARDRREKEAVEKAVCESALKYLSSKDTATHEEQLGFTHAQRRVEELKFRESFLYR